MSDAPLEIIFPSDEPSGTAKKEEQVAEFPEIWILWLSRKCEHLADSQSTSKAI